MSEIRGESRSVLPSWVTTTFDAHGAPRRPALPPRARRAVRVLLVDDSDADRVRFGRALSDAGYEVHAAEDGSQAWERLQQQDFDVVVSDRQMPGTDGIELIRLVRTSRELARLPVIMVSGMDAPKDREVGLAAGAAEYISKNDEGAAPVLLRSVERLTRSDQGATAAKSAKPLFERALVVDRSGVARQLLSRALRSYCGAIATVASVAEARDHLDGEVSLVVLDATLEGALSWFEERCARESKPAFVIVTSRPSQGEETRFSLLGAIGYLAKPISIRQLSHALLSSTKSYSPAPPRAHVFPLAEVSIADPSSGEPQLSCAVLNLSAGGALLATMGPIELGTRLFLCLALEGRTIPIPARVARIQEPGWGVVGGCGVVFEYDRDDSRRIVERFVDARGDLRLQPRYSVSRTPAR